MFRLDLQIGTHDWTLTLWTDGVAGASCPVLVRGSKAIVKLPPSRPLCEQARLDWLQIADELKRKTYGSVTEVIAGEQ